MLGWWRCLYWKEEKKRQLGKKNIIYNLSLEYIIWSDSSYSLLVSLFGCMSAGLVAVPLLEGGEKEAIR